MPIKKISKKTLSRNLKLKKSPLKVLPLGTRFGANHLLPQREKEPTEQRKEKSFSSTNNVQCPMEEFHTTKAKHMKKPGRRKVPITVLPYVKIRLTMHALRWIFMLIFLYLAAGTFIIMFQDGFASMKTVIIYSIMGFFTFFMGYFGMVFAKDILKIVARKKGSFDEVNI